MIDTSDCMTPEEFEAAAMKYAESRSERLRSDIHSDMLENVELTHA